ncbi:hypothetical protein [Ectopseudomonas mendocina]|uniref:hypothetical protein n=1 Tax=Ectopseudomonas mendocina TaxID=300 RepID=UPI00376F0FA5
MELTTPQIYGIFAALSCAAIAGFIFYCIGLRAGRDAGEKQGKEQARAACEELLQHRIAEAEDLRSQLDARTREAMTLRNNIKAEAEDHAKVERGLLNRLAAAAPLSNEDHAVLLAVGAKLELAADTFAGINSPDHARFSRHLMAQVLDIADRIKKAQANAQPHPDTELIEWLNDHAVHYIPDMSLVQIEMPTLLTAADTWPPHLRQMLRAGIAKQAAEAVEAAA